MYPCSGAISSGSVDEDLIETDDQMDITDEGDDVEEAEDLSIKPCQEPGSPSSQGENVSSMLGLLINKFGFSNIQVRLDYFLIT